MRKNLERIVFFANTLFIATTATTALAIESNQAKSSSTKSCLFNKTQEKEYIIKQMKLVTDYQIARLKDHKTRIDERRWELAPFFRGLAAVYRATNDEKYLNLMEKIAKDSNYQLGLRKGHADDHAIVQLYLELAWITGKKHYLEQAKKDFKHQMKVMHKYTFRFRNYCHRWAWADALFMAPPAWAGLSSITKDNSYMDFMVKEFKTNTSKLYSSKYHLYYRDERYLKKLNKNGKPIFWSRGNGWVYAGLASVMQWMPKNHSNEQYFKNIFDEMSQSLIKIQNPKNGLWPMNLADATEYPLYETSGSAFFCYGLFWGINNGLLNKKQYLPYAIKAWKGLNEKVTSQGRVTYVQPVGYEPDELNSNDTEIYGVGAYLMAAEEYLKFIKFNQERKER